MPKKDDHFIEQQALQVLGGMSPEDSLETREEILTAALQWLRLWRTQHAQQRVNLVRHADG